MVLKSFLILFSISAQAYDLNPKMEWKPAEPDPHLIENVQTKEAVVDINGARYRQIEYKGERFYVRFLARDPNNDDPVFCMNTVDKSRAKPYQIKGEVQLTKRSTAFVEGLKTRCQKIEDPADIKIGIAIDNNRNKQTNVTVNPVNQNVGVSVKNKKSDDESEVHVSPNGQVGAGTTF